MTDEEWAKVKEAAGRSIADAYWFDNPIEVRVEAWDLWCWANKEWKDHQRDSARQRLVERARRDGYITQ